MEKVKPQPMIIAALCAALLAPAAQAKATAPRKEGPRRPVAAAPAAAKSATAAPAAANFAVAAKASDSASRQPERMALAETAPDTAAAPTATDASVAVLSESEAAPVAPAAGETPAPAAAELQAPAEPAEPVAAVPAPAVEARPIAERIAGWEQNQLGVTIQGQASSRVLQSALSGPSATVGQATHENLAYTRADVEFQARPSTATRGRLEFRLHQDWENYYEEGPNPLLARWFEFGGKLFDGKVDFGLGDFRGQYSALTLYSPGLDIPNEPEIFAARRKLTMDEWHLGGHALPLQGLHAEYANRFSPAFALSAGGIASRLRTGGASQSTWLFWTDDVEKLMGAGYLKADLFGGLELGATRIQIVDPVKTSRALNNEYVQKSPSAQFENVTVNAGNLGFDAKRFLSDGPFTLRAGAEFAQSNYMPAHDKVDTVGTITVNKPVGQSGTLTPVQVPVTALRLIKEPEIKDDALRAGLHAGFRESGEGAFGIALDAAFLRNGKDYVNDVAQSPVFLGRRILNSANQVGGFGGYNTFDAAYNNVYTVDPVTSVNTSEFWASDAKTYNGTNNWYRAPQFKNSYSNTVMTRSERLQASAFLDPQLQLLLPFGPATPNREGIDASLKAKAMEGKLEASVLFASLKEPDGYAVDATTTVAGQTFGRIGGGVKAQVGSFLGLDRRITVIAGWMEDNAKRPAFAYQDSAYAEVTVKSGLASAGVYANVWRGLSLSAGYQQIKSNPYKGYDVAGETKTAKQADLTQGNWAIGAEYRIAAGVYANAEYGQLSLEEAKSATKFSQDLVSAGLVVGF